MYDTRIIIKKNHEVSILKGVFVMTTEQAKQYLAYATEMEKAKYTMNRAIRGMNYKINELGKKEYVPSPEYRTVSFDFGEMLSILAGEAVLYFVAMIIIDVVVWLHNKVYFSVWNATIPKVVVLGIMLALFILYLAFSISGYNDDKRENWNRECEYKQKLKRADQIQLSKEAQRRSLIAQRDLLQRQCNSTDSSLRKFYDAGNWHQKFRNLAAVATMHEYLETKRCLQLEGPGGAIDYYYGKLALGEIVGRLDDIIDKLEDIRHSQFELYSAIKEGNRKSDQLYQSALRTENYARISSENNEITAYN